MSTTTTITTQTATGGTVNLKAAFDTDVHAKNKYNYTDYLPVYDETTSFPPIEPFEAVHRGLTADKAKPNLLKTGDPNVEITRLTPRIGTEIKGLQLSKLSDDQKNELALLVAERGVVVFRDQDFKDIGLKKQKEFGEYFGRLHVHVSLGRLPMDKVECRLTKHLPPQPVGAHVKDYIEFHNIYLGADNLYRLQQRSSKLTTT
jgi:sulfonate dioxygenase